MAFFEKRSFIIFFSRRNFVRLPYTNDKVKFNDNWCAFKSQNYLSIREATQRDLTHTLPAPLSLSTMAVSFE